MAQDELVGMGRELLMQLIKSMREDVVKLEAQFKEVEKLNSHLLNWVTDLQEKGTKLVESRRAMRENIARHLMDRGYTWLASDVRALKYENPPEEP